MNSPRLSESDTAEGAKDARLSWLAAALPGLYLLLTSTTNLVPGIWPYDAKRMLQFALLLLLFLLPMLNRRIQAASAAVLSAIPRWARLSLGAVFALGVVSAAANAQSVMHLLNSLSEVVLLGTLLAAVIVIAACRRIGGRVFDRIAVGMLALTSLTVGLQELLGVAAAQAGGVDFNFRISLLHFSWPRFYNQVQSWTVPVIAALPLLFIRYPLARVLAVVALALNWYIILMTGARGSFLALAAAMVFALLFLPSARKQLLTWQLSGLVCGALLFMAVLFTFEADSPAGPPASASAAPLAGKPAPPAGFYGNESDSTSGFLAQSVGRPLLDPRGRTWMWKVTLRDAGQNPLLGIGPMNYVCTSPEHIGHPHSFPLQLAAEWGVPAATVVSLLFLVLFWRLVRTLRSAPSPERDDTTLASLLTTGLLAAALHACVSGVMVTPASQVAGLLICGWLLGLTSAPEMAAASARPRKLSPIVAGLLLSAGLLLLGTHELRTLAERSDQLKTTEKLYPRIWQDARVCQLYTGQQAVSN